MYSWVRGEGSQVLHRMKTLSSGRDANIEMQPREDSKVTEELTASGTFLHRGLRNSGEHESTSELMQKTEGSEEHQNTRGGIEEEVEQGQEGLCQDRIQSLTSVNKTSAKERVPWESGSGSHASGPSMLAKADANRIQNDGTDTSKGSNGTQDNEQPEAAVKDAADTARAAGAHRRGAWKRGGMRLNGNESLHLQRLQTISSRQSRASVPVSFVRADEPFRLVERAPRKAGRTRSGAIQGRSSSVWSSALIAMGVNSRRRQKLVCWSEGIRPQVVFASYAEEGDGTTATLSPTLLPRISTRHRCWETVSGRAFVVRLIGSFMADDAPTTIFASANGRTIRYARRGRGWRAASCERELVRARGGELSVCAGATSGGDGSQLCAEMLWRTDDGSGGAGAASAALRFGFYFVLRGAGSVRMMASTATPERVRLVAMRREGSVHNEATRAVSYVVLHVAAH
eukprot:TRINITY_DN77_c0_g1_i12.p2 TRINITY_DN77_c0_g1~~TRINITY_DN77_c0_g1_i12.p2  ORF type:complete len:457 (-),score=56.43 TRINITY_DN77_c0_g1_i12:1175-2545(-)